MKFNVHFLYLKGDMITVSMLNFFKRYNLEVLGICFSTVHLLTGPGLSQSLIIFTVLYTVDSDIFS